MERVTGKRRMALAALVAAAIMTAGPASAQTLGMGSTETQWAIGLGYGSQSYGADGSTGTATAIQVLYRARVLAGAGHSSWLYEFGAEYSQSGDAPEIDDAGTESELTTVGAFYRINRLFGDRLYGGGRLGLSSVDGGDPDDDGIAVGVGVQGGFLITDRISVGIETVLIDPSSKLDGAPMETRGTFTVGF